MKNAVNFTVFLWCNFVLLISNVTESAVSTTTGAVLPDCSNVILYLSDCLPFVRNGSTDNHPNGTCCDGLKTVIKTDAFCVCEIFKSSAQIGDGINFTKAMSLPSVCNLSNSSTITCGQFAPSPSSAPAPAEIIAPAAPGSAIIDNTPPGRNATLASSSSSSSSTLAFTFIAGLLFVVAHTFSLL